MIQRFKHDHCDKCRFVCQAGRDDVWICHEFDSLIARHGDDPCDYGSMPRTVFKYGNIAVYSYEENYENMYIKIWLKLLDNHKWSCQNDTDYKVEESCQLIGE